MTEFMDEKAINIVKQYVLDYLDKYNPAPEFEI